MDPCIVAAIATAVVAAGTYYVSVCSPLAATARSVQPQHEAVLKPQPLMKRSPDEIVNLAWNALARNDRLLAFDVLEYCNECPIQVLGEAAAHRLGEEVLGKLDQLAHGQGDAY